MPRTSTGFSLIELLMVVSILGLLLALVVPGFQQTLRQAHRSEAVSALLSAANELQQTRAQSGNYADALSAEFPEPGNYQLNLATDLTGPIALPAGSALSQLSCNGVPCFALAATETGGQIADTDCALFTLDYLGRKRSYQTDGRQNTPGTNDPCW
ncbi:type IV pilin protein [Saccharospirillum mangrovi]|uniref:type IV pilin protein n=1 Tax=Saccharospirillum mangrovi TaxID=2161747 RepID=UPI0013B447EB|nr:type IV pilin protein [Saccharospirillum mangrovi]